MQTLIFRTIGCVMTDSGISAHDDQLVDVLNMDFDTGEFDLMIRIIDAVVTDG